VAPYERYSPHGGTFSAGEGEQKGGAPAVWAIFCGMIFTFNTCAYSGVKNDRTKSALANPHRVEDKKLTIYRAANGQRIKGLVV
jgi:hypothetical protein